MEAQLANQLLKAAATVEQKLDEELNKLESLGDDDLEEIRRKRMLDMRKAQEKKQVGEFYRFELMFFVGIAVKWAWKVDRTSRRKGLF
jgi:hypothetical protein